MRNLFLCLLLIPAFVLADYVPPPAITAPAPHEAGYMNNINATYDPKMNNGRGGYSMKALPSSSKSHFNSVSNKGGDIVGGRPVNATVNNGYGDAGKISTQAASKYSKLGGIRGIANKSLGPISNAVVVYQLSNWTGEQLYNLYDCVVYQSCHPGAKPPPVPPNAPAPPQSAWEQPQGAYDPNAESVTVFLNNNNQPALAVYGLPLGSGSKYVLPEQQWIVNGINVVPYGTVDGGFVWVAFETFTDAASLAKYANISIDKVRPDDFRPHISEQDLYNALLWNLENMPQDIATAIMNALHDGGFLGAPDSTVFDPASYTSPPYTAADTGIAQQDKFTLNQDGSITHQVAARPDLQGNSQLAPEKQPSTNPTNPTDPTTPTDPKPETPEIDWDMPVVPDTAIPTQEIPIFFNPDNSFNNNGVCPQPRTFTVFKRTYGISYEPMCDFGNQARPMIILCGILLSMLMVFSALNGGKEA